MKILVVDSRHNIGSWLIKLFTFSRWNHTATWYEDQDMVFDSTFATGVRCLSKAEFDHIYTRKVIREAFLPNEDKALLFALSQVGKKYDFTGLLGIVFQKRSWMDPDKWWCSELSEAQCTEGGNPAFIPEANSILPRDSFIVLRKP
jgi:uncharacterized protein YycO